MKTKKRVIVIGFWASTLATLLTWFLVRNTTLVPSQQQLQTLSMLKITELNKQYGVTQISDIFGRSQPSSLSLLLNSVTTVQGETAFRVLEDQDGVKSSNEMIVEIQGEKLLFSGLRRVNLQEASSRYKALEEISHAEPNYLIELSTSSLNQKLLERRKKILDERRRKILELRKQKMMAEEAKSKEESSLQEESPVVVKQPKDELALRIAEPFLVGSLNLPEKLGSISRFDASQKKIPSLAFFIPDGGASFANPYIAKNISMGSELSDSRRYVQQEPGDPTSDGHGTHVAGMVVGIVNAMSYYSGQSRSADIITYRAFQGKSTTASELALVLKGLVHDVRQSRADINIISASWGTPKRVKLIADILEELDDDVIILAATGNGGDKSEIHFPAREFVAVTALEQKGGVLADYANYQKGYPLLYASIGGSPGSKLLSTGKYPPEFKTLAGTSQATPAVAAMLGSLMRIYPGASPEHLLRHCSRIISGVYPVKEFNPSYCE